MWSIKNLEYRKSDGLVITAIAQYKGVEVIVPLPEPEGKIIPYEDLNEVTVLQWVYDNYPTDIIAEKIDSEIVESENDLGKPW